MCTIVPADEQEVKAKTSGGASDGRGGVPRRAGWQSLGRSATESLLS